MIVFQIFSFNVLTTCIYNGLFLNLALNDRFIQWFISESSTESMIFCMRLCFVCMGYLCWHCSQNLRFDELKQHSDVSNGLFLNQHSDVSNGLFLNLALNDRFIQWFISESSTESMIFCMRLCFVCMGYLCWHCSQNLRFDELKQHRDVSKRVWRFLLNFLCRCRLI